MLTDAGFDFNKEYTLSYAERTRPYFPQPTKIAQAVQAQLAEIGVKVKLTDGRVGHLSARHPRR